MESLLPNSYEQYKNDTSVFMTWLAQAAQRCGYELPGKARNKTKQPSDVYEKGSQASTTERHALPVKEISVQAEAVANAKTPQVKPPASILQAAQRAINTRTRFAACFSEMGIEFQADESHRHFIGVLQHALDLLRGCLSDGPRKPKVAHDSPNVRDDITNRFDVLDVEDCDDAGDTATDSQHDSSKAVSPDQSGTPIIVLDLSSEVDMLIDMKTRAFCFFDDLHSMQGRLQEVWNDYKNGTIDLTTAAMTTNAAISLVEQAERELAMAWPSLERLRSVALGQFNILPKASYQGLVLQFRPEIHSCCTIPELADPTASLSPLGDYIYADTWWTLMKYARQSEEEFSVWPRIPSLRMAYQDYFLLFPAPRSFEEVIHHEKFPRREREDEWLTQLLMDTLYNKRLTESFVSMKFPRLDVMDEFSRAMSALEEGETITLRMIFAATIMKDIHRVLGHSTSQAYSKLQQMVKQCHEAVKDSNPDPRVRRGTGPHWLTNDVKFITGIFDFVNFIDNWGLSGGKAHRLQDLAPSHFDYPLDGIKEGIPLGFARFMESSTCELNVESTSLMWVSFVKKCNESGIYYVRPAKDLEFAFKGNPLLCGTMAFNFAILKEQAGVSLANHHLSILHTTHLYNALRQKSLLQGIWPDIEHLTDTHLKPLFFGARPTTPEDIFKRFHLRLGFPAHLLKALSGSRTAPRQWGNYLVEGRGGDGTNQAKKGPTPSCLAINTCSETFVQFFEGESSLIRTLHAADRLMRKHTKNTSLDPGQFLAQFPGWIEETMAPSSIDYIGLTRTCNGLLKSLLDSGKIDMHTPKLRRPGVGAANSNNPFLVQLTHQILWEDKERQLAEPGLKRKGRVILNKSDIQIAGEFVQEWLKGRKLLETDPVT
ncbi:uncharacterized protein BDZ99DRAFT_576178 [Mytilinidion resinicola]|uniref:DUF6604 domain-containing protein n=1 Tax=Mytilinidion resinicola TaxID=574789 RepID=A0A6A6Y363_9PEZI|nr:uncharacterized protein BDZ99DRAFT_576178 [Mytilinidion resinicola]KAF2803261.1 hypothetical protein BDZ99DRAFT_576178 [Mytilinidion resinicola]